MALVNSVIGFLYEAVMHSWQVASVVLKYFLAANIIILLRYEENLSLDKLESNMLKYGKPVILGTGLLGLVFAAINLTVTPGFRFLSEFTAVLVLGFLFWKY